jgi:ketosteroid isomerase-like protein
MMVATVTSAIYSLPSSTQGVTMHEQKNLDVVKEAYVAINENCHDALLECFDENVKWFAIGSPHRIPTAGTRYGVEQLGHYLSLSGEKFKPLEFISDDDKVVALGEQEFHVGKTGSSIRSPWVHVFTVHRGRITEVRAFYDTAATIDAFDTDVSKRPGKQAVNQTRIPAIF